MIFLFFRTFIPHWDPLSLILNRHRWIFTSVVKRSEREDDHAYLSSFGIDWFYTATPCCLCRGNFTSNRIQILNYGRSQSLVFMRKQPVEISTVVPSCLTNIQHLKTALTHFLLKTRNSEILKGVVLKV